VQDEVRARPGRDLVVEDGADDLLVLNVGHVVSRFGKGLRPVREQIDEIGQADQDPFVGAQGQQGHAVVDRVEPAFANLPERHHREYWKVTRAWLGQVNHQGDVSEFAEQDLDGVRPDVRAVKNRERWWIGRHQA
jgi:hypothetical protein